MKTHVRSGGVREANQVLTYPTRSTTTIKSRAFNNFISGDSSDVPPPYSEKPRTLQNSSTGSKSTTISSSHKNLLQHRKNAQMQYSRFAGNDKLVRQKRPGTAGAIAGRRIREALVSSRRPSLPTAEDDKKQVEKLVQQAEKSIQMEKQLQQLRKFREANKKSLENRHQETMSKDLSALKAALSEARSKNAEKGIVRRPVSAAAVQSRVTRHTANEAIMRPVLKESRRKSEVSHAGAKTIKKEVVIEERAPVNTPQQNVSPANKQVASPVANLLQQISNRQPTKSSRTSAFTHTSSTYSHEELRQSINMAASLIGSTDRCSREEAIHLCQIIADPRHQGQSTSDFYSFGKVLGVGSFGKVRAGIHKLTTQSVAIKTYERSKTKDENQWRRIEQEVRLMKRLNHPHIGRMFESIHSQRRIHIVMEYVSGTNLCDYVKKHRRLTEDVARVIFDQVLGAVAYLHDLNIIHRDIKLENILLDEFNHTKLVDFGFSVCVPDKKFLKMFCGTPSYMPPELVQRKEYNGKLVDLWSLGVLLYAMLVGRFPFTASNYNNLYRKIIKGNYEIPEFLSDKVQHLITSLLVKDPRKRISLAELRVHPWIKQSPISVEGQEFQAKAETLPRVAHLVSMNPISDLSPAALEHFEAFGIPKHLVSTSVLQAHHNSITAFYYLFQQKAENLRIQTRTKMETQKLKLNTSSKNSRKQNAIGWHSGESTEEKVRDRPHARPQEQQRYTSWSKPSVTINQEDCNLLELMDGVR